MNGPLHLALDTSTSRPVAAILRGEKLLQEWIGPEGLKHHETLLAGIHESFEKAGIQLADLQFLSVGIGPGMFTGLRIGITTAKFLADPLNIPCVPVSSLLALASQGGKSTGCTWALSDAKAKRVYAMPFTKHNADFSASADEEIAITPEEAANKIQSGDFLIGEAALLYKDLWPKDAKIAEGDANILLASSIGILGAKRFSLGLTCSATDLLPKYLKSGNSHL